MRVDQLPQTDMSGYTAGAPDRGRLPKRVQGRWRTRGILVLGAVALLAAAAALIAGAMTPREEGPRLTHAIARGDLVVTITEQGTLESSNNTEIKCRVRGTSTVLWVIEAGTMVKPGDELVKLDTSAIEDKINQQKIVYQKALATHTQSETDVAVAKIAITEYLEGAYRSKLKTLEKDLAIAESHLRSAKNVLEHTQRMFRKGYVSQLEVEGSEFTVVQAQLELEVKQTEIEALERFTKAKEMETLQSTLKAAEAKLASDKAALELEKSRLDREEEQLSNCVIVAETSGMVILPSAAEWKDTPDIEEGAVVREDQVLLMIPDLTQMQVKVGIHESKVESVKPGMAAKVVLQDRTIQGSVFSVASVTRPAGWWTGNVVKYDTIIKLESNAGLKPGMSAEVEVTLARHEDVLTIPVAAVVEAEQEYFCWVKSEGGVQRRALRLGETNDQFIVVEAGVKEGDEVVLNPIAYLAEAQVSALKPLDETKKPEDTGQKTPVRG
ncbi:MAG: HlyD family efflux transporter periplasmic adaptor subunit [Pirellulaceae bacterium]|nr:HlyD family efflux transporter periplasmic adaptor subunit [Pirellulaceae bacterium]